MNIHDVIRDLEAIKKHFKKILQADQVDRSAQTISWHRYESGFSDRVSYVREYQRLLDRQQYSFLFDDSSFVQFYYEFDREGELESAKLAFYPAPVTCDDELEELIEDLAHCTPDIESILLEHIEKLESEGERPTNVSHIRLDYDSSVTTHCKAHLQFGGINNLRISSNKVLLPLTFMETVAAAFYKEHREDLLKKERYREDLKRAKRKSLASELSVAFQCYMSI